MSINTIAIIIAMIFFGVGGLFFIHSYNEMRDKVKELKYDYDLVSDILKSNNNITNKIISAYEKSEEIYKILMEQYDTMSKQNDVMTAQYKGITKHYKELCDRYDKLLVAWGNIEEKYSATYEEFSYCSDKLLTIEKMIKDMKEGVEIDFKINPPNQLVSDYPCDVKGCTEEARMNCKGCAEYDEWMKQHPNLESADNN